jgi:hypothetical protein
MTRRRHICDVPGCGTPRQRWQRLCDQCFAGLAKNRDVRYGISDAFHTKKRRVHRQLCQRAAAILGFDKLAGAPAPAAEPEARPRFYWQDRD